MSCQINSPKGADYYLAPGIIPATEHTFLAGKGYDVKNIYIQVKNFYEGECIIPLNKRNTKNPKLLPQENPVCEAGLPM